MTRARDAGTMGERKKKKQPERERERERTRAHPPMDCIASASRVCSQITHSRACACARLFGRVQRLLARAALDRASARECAPVRALGCALGLSRPQPERSFRPRIPRQIRNRWQLDTAGFRPYRPTCRSCYVSSVLPRVMHIRALDRERNNIEFRRGKSRRTGSSPPAGAK